MYGSMVVKAAGADLKRSTSASVVGAITWMLLEAVPASSASKG